MSEATAAAPVTPTAAPAGDAKASAEVQPGAGATEVVKPDAKPADPAAKPSEVAGTEPEKKPDAKPERIAAKIEDLRKREQALKERELKLTTSSGEYEKVKGELDAIKAAKGDPRKWLEAGGFKDMEDFVKAIAKNPEAAKAASEVEKLRAEIAAKEKKEGEEAEQRAHAETSAKAIARVKGEIEKAGDAAEFVAIHGDAGVDDVVRVIGAYFDKHGVLPDIKEAIKQVDSHYEAQWKKGASTKRGKLLAVPAAVVPDPKAAAAKVEPKVEPKTGEQPRRRSERAELQAQLEESFNAKGGTP